MKTPSVPTKELRWATGKGRVTYNLEVTHELSA